MKLLNENAKLRKCREFGYLAMGLELTPGVMAGRGEACPNRGDCYKTCLVWSGYGSMPTTLKARIARHQFMVNAPGDFNGAGQFNESALFQLDREIKKATVKAQKLGLKLAIRLNVFSDYPWENVYWLFRDNPTVQFYDYTKDPLRMRKWVAGELPANYHLTFSFNEKTKLPNDIFTKVTTAQVVREDEKTRRLSNIPGWARDGDLHDLTFIHPQGTMLLLSAKGKGGGRNPAPNRFLDPGIPMVSLEAHQ